MTETEKHDYILANWRTVPKKEMCKAMNMAESTFERRWFQLHTQGLVPKKRVLNKHHAQHMQPVLEDEHIIRFIIEHNATMTKTDMMSALTVCARRFRKIYKEVAATGAIVPRLHGGHFDPKKVQKPIAKPAPISFEEFPRALVMPWVPKQFVNHNARWHG